jgi:hypothetical protein
MEQQMQRNDLDFKRTWCRLFSKQDVYTKQDE